MHSATHVPFTLSIPTTWRRDCGVKFNDVAA